MGRGTGNQLGSSDADHFSPMLSNTYYTVDWKSNTSVDLRNRQMR